MTEETPGGGGREGSDASPSGPAAPAGAPAPDASPAGAPPAAESEPRSGEPDALWSAWRLPRPTRGAWAVWRRNALVWRKLIAPSLIFNFGEPLIYLLGLGFGLGRFIGEIEGLDYFTFLASGLVATAAMNAASFEGLYSVYTRMVPQHTYEGMLATPLEVDDIVGGETLWCATKALVSGVAILVVAALLGAVEGPQALLAVPCLALVGLAFAGPAIVVSALAPSYDFFNYYVTVVMTPMFVLGGVFYPVSTLPEAAQAAVQLLPLTHAIALVRPLVAGEMPPSPLVSIGVLVGYAALGFYFAVALVRRRLVI